MNSRVAMGILALLIAKPTWASKAACERERDAYEKHILPRIKGGVPFELIALAQKGEATLASRQLRLRYDLWDEVLFISAANSPQARCQKANTWACLCNQLDITRSIATGERYRFKILVDPLWQGRVERLAQATGKVLSQGTFLEMNWSEIVRKMPSRNIAVDVEVAP
jgi:hypothetical protein